MGYCIATARFVDQFTLTVCLDNVLFPGFQSESSEAPSTARVSFRISRDRMNNLGSTKRITEMRQKKRRKRRNGSAGSEERERSGSGRCSRKLLTGLSLPLSTFTLHFSSHSFPSADNGPDDTISTLNSGKDLT